MSNHTVNNHSQNNNAKSFNQSINSWKLRAKNDNKNDKDISMYDMFFDASLYNQPMNEWDVSSVR